MNKAENLWKMWERIEIINLQQQKAESIILYQNQTIILHDFTETLFGTEMRKTQTLMNELVYLGLSI